MDASITEFEADTLFAHTRVDNFVPQQPAQHDSFLQFVGLLSSVQLPTEQAVLVWRRRPGAEPETCVLRDSLTLGKLPGCTISVPEIPTVSKLHFIIDRTSSGYLLTDCSTNGTFLYPGTRRIPPGEPYLLNNGDLMWVEGMVLAFKAA